MNHLTFIFITATFFAFAPTKQTRAQEKTKTFSINLSNTINQDRTDAPVVIDLKKLPTDFSVKSATVYCDGKEIPSQLDDLDLNNEYDEIAFVTDIAKKSNKNIQIVLSEKKTIKNYKQRVHVDMQISDKNKKYPEIQTLSFPGTVPASITYNSVYHHGPEFESELTGYRLYFDNRQSIDIYGKRERRLELPETRFYTTAEQKAAGYGTDVLWAGKSVSVGSFRGWNGESTTYVDTVELRTQSVIAYGPIRSIVDVIDKNWQYNGKTLNMHQRYIQYAGHRDVEVHICFEKPLNGEVFATGVMKLPTGNNGFITKDGLAASWGTNQPEPKDPTLETVGLGVSISKKYIVKTLEDETNYLFLIGGNGQKEIIYNLTFCAEKEIEGFKSAGEWLKYAKAWNKELSTPLEIKIK